MTTTMKWPQVEHVKRQARQMGMMLDRLGIDAVVAAQRGLGTLFARASRNCLSCPVSDKCRAWLADPAADTTQPPAFCPNARLFGEWQRARLRRPGRPH
ncbi:DUF6455 family protein [Chelatococcus sp. SYSU_G07232]|uniref:DUF6455 family protein n=1 Tax=Chelatococcus albus TaxID=3047466 RepID=A0ABT7AFS8_9HYPH|nr:DUF6455 family protein [Chelatococcus sp. SYSU_G07232]MDJ1158206.1 DUF6455 family protein [Chelatococcus sp. SYSU_G07232]